MTNVSDDGRAPKRISPHPYKGLEVDDSLVMRRKERTMKWKAVKWG